MVSAREKFGSCARVRNGCLAGVTRKLSAAFSLVWARDVLTHEAVPTPVSLDDVTPAGELRHRSEKNLRRLYDPEFHFAAASTASTVADAPGDWLGRSLLGLALYARVLRIEPPHADEIVARLPEVLNARGYIGELHPPGTADENQVGGHNGLLRGLCEFYLWKRDPRALALIRSVVTGLMLPTQPLYAHYPDHALKALLNSQWVGLTVRQPTGVWRGLSTDIGTVFFTLDGLTQAYTIDPTPALRGLIETMIARYAQIDPVAISAQTHATLTTLRGIFRWWEEVDPRPELLALVRTRFQLYRDHAQTEHHSNYNWFGRPDWTEVCAVVDSFQLAVQLWTATGDAELLEEAHRVFYNGFYHAQRPNGGFGCDLCVGARGERVLAAHEFFEAPWCCSMRGAEGLTRAAQYGWFVAADTLTLPFYFGGTATVRFADGAVQFEQESAYPLEGRVRLRVTAVAAASGNVSAKTLRFFAPSWSPAASFAATRNGAPLAVDGSAERFAAVTVPLMAGDVIDVAFAVNFSALPLQNPARQPGQRRFAHGPLFLGSDARAASAGDEPAFGSAAEFTALGGARYRCVRTGRELAPLPVLVDLTDADAKARRTQMVFNA